MKQVDCIRICHITGICLFIMCGLMSCSNLIKKEPHYDICFHGEQSQKKNTPFIVTGKNVTVVGMLGSSISTSDSMWNDMTGIWLDSTKIVDCMWLKISDGVNNEEGVLKPSEMVVYPHHLAFDYPDVLEGITVKSELLASDAETGVMQSFYIKNNTDKDRSINLEFVVETNLKVASCFEGERRGPGNKLDWDSKGNIFAVNNWKNDSYVVWGSDIKVASFGTGMSGGKGARTVLSSMYSQLFLKAGKRQRVTYILVGSTQLLEDAKECYNKLWENKDKELDRKKEDISLVLEEACLQSDSLIFLDKKFYWSVISRYWQHSSVNNSKVPVNILVNKMMENLDI